MDRCETVIDVPVEDVWATLADGESFHDWVVGCKEVRKVEGDRPSPGSSIHHSIGVGKVTLDDTTSVVEMEENRRLVLRARIRPAGVAGVIMTLSPAGPSATTVVMEEDVAEGPASHVPDAITDPLLHARNVETLRRLKNLAERRSSTS
jgi:uncharacterized protein YndB with AHSA1/START domain